LPFSRKLVWPPINRTFL